MLRWAEDRNVCAMTFLTACLLAGCGDSDQVPMVSAEGKVVYRDTPSAHALVVLHPVSGPAQEHNLRPYGWTDGSGRFSLSTLKDCDGAPAGQYRAAVTWPAGNGGGTDSNDPETQRSGEDRLQGRYADPMKSGLDVTVDGQEITIRLK
jgi:hypothetical protein